MQILYCDSCGFRIPEKDLAEGRATRTAEGKLQCEKCRPGKSTEVQVAAARSSSHKMAPAQRGGEKTSSIHIQLAGHKPSPASSARPAQTPRPEAKSNALVIGIGVGVAAVVLLVALLSGGSHKPPAEERTEARNTPPTPVPVTPFKPTSTRPTVTEPEPRPMPQVNPTPVEARPDEVAFDKLTRFEGLEAADAAGHVAQIEAFLETYKDSILAARARTLLNEWKAKAGAGFVEGKTDTVDVIKQDPPATGAKARATFVKSDETTHGHWVGVFGKDGYYIPGFLDKRNAPAGAIARDRTKDLLKLPAYVASFNSDNEEIRGVMNDTPTEAWLDGPDGKSRRLCYDVVPRGGTMTYSLSFTDDRPHRVALFFGTGSTDRSMTIQLIDAASKAELDTRNIKGSFFSNGGYLVYEIAGNVQFIFRSLSTNRGLCSGVFFDPSGDAAPPPPPEQAPSGAVTNPGPKPETAEAAARVEELQTAELLSELRREARPLLKAGRYAEALKALQDKAKLERYASVAAASALEVEDAKALVDAKKEALEALKAQAGKSMTVTISGRQVTGTLKVDAKRDDLALRMSGGAEIAFSAEQLEPADLVALLPRAEGAGRMEDLRRRGLLNLYAGNVAMAKSCFAGAKEAGLANAERYLKLVEEFELGDQEVGARALWEKGEAFLKASAWLEAQKAFLELQKTCAATPWVTAHAAEIAMRLERIDGALHPEVPGLVATYYKGRNLEADDLCLTRVEAAIDHDFGHGSPSNAVPADNYSARYTGLIKVPAAGHYTFATFSDDGSRLSIDGKKVIDRWSAHPPERTAGEIELTEGFHAFVLDYFEGVSNSEIHLFWAQKDGFAEQIIPASAFFRREPAMPPLSATRAYLSNMTETSSKVGYGSLRKSSSDTTEFKVQGVKYEHWLYAHADSSVEFALGKQYRRLDLSAGLSDTGKSFKDRLRFSVLLDGKQVWASDDVRSGSAPVPCVLDVTGAEKLELRADTVDRSNAHAVWLEPFLTK